MNLNTIVEVKRPKSFEEIGWRDGHAFLGGGTWLFSEPQVATDTLVDLPGLGWPALTVTPAGLEMAATCRIVELHDFKGPPEWRAVPLFDKCIDAFLMSFKIWNAATVGGNVCMSLPAGAMVSLTAALEGVCTLWPRNGKPRQVPVVDFVTGNHINVLQKGEVLRSIQLPASALSKRFAMRQVSLTHLGRSAALIIATVGDEGRGLPADHQRGDAAAGASALHRSSVCRANCGRRSRSACHRTPGSTTSMDRRPTSVTSPSIWPNRFARSST